MKMIFLTVLVCFILTQTFGQSSNKLTTCLLAQFNNTISDRTKGNNPWGVGLGLQTYFNNSTRFKPTIELTGDIYLEDDKVFRLNNDGSIPPTPNDVRGMVNLFAGSSFHPAENIYLSFVAGPSFINGQTLLGIKPSVGFYFSKYKKWTGKISYINIFNRDKINREDFGTLSLAIGLKLF
ncbi:MAG: hypothetical protein ABI707_10980 [Ferruginibacter sp.]